MYDKEQIKKIKQERDKWEKNCYGELVKIHPERKEEFRNLSNIEIKNLYTPIDIANKNYLNDIGFPGMYPFLRGIHSTMYRGRLWTMRQFSGFGSAEETNQRYKYLLNHGETGLSVAFDYPTLYGYDTDHPLARGAGLGSEHTQTGGWSVPDADTRAIGTLLPVSTCSRPQMWACGSGLNAPHM